MRIHLDIRIRFVEPLICRISNELLLNFPLTFLSLQLKAHEILVISFAIPAIRIPFANGRPSAQVALQQREQGQVSQLLRETLQFPPRSHRQRQRQTPQDFR